MPYYRCTNCGLTVHAVARRLTQPTCPNCSVALSEADQVYIREPHPAAISRRYTAEPSAAPAARRALESLLWNLDDAEYQLTALLTTELIANSIEHAGTGPHGSVRLDVSLTASLIRIDVSDSGPGFVPTARTAASPLDSHWGLHLVSELADRWAVEAASDTSVWFELDRAPAAA